MYKYIYICIHICKYIYIYIFNINNFTTKQNIFRNFTGRKGDNLTKQRQIWT